MNKSLRIIFCLSLAAVIASGIFGIVGMSRAVVYAAPAATTWYVNASSGNDANDCLTPGTACATIAAAILKASGGDTIEIAAGTYHEHDIQIYKELTLTGAGRKNTIVDAGGNGRLFRIGVPTTLSGLTLKNGQTPDTGSSFTRGGGAILATDDLTLQQVRLLDNHAGGSGGAIFNSGTLLLENSQVLSNTAQDGGGGIFNYSLGDITVINSILAYNTASASGIGGGGVYAGGHSLTIQNSTLAYNSATYLGGGLDINLNGPTVLDGVTLTGNQSVGGAGLFASSGALTMTNSTISGNIASNDYGGIYVSGPNTNLYLQNSTIAYNTRTNTSGSGTNGVMIGNNATVSMVNTILAFNQERNCSSFSPPTSLGHNLSSDSNCGLTQTGDQPGVDPLLGALADNGGLVKTHALLPGSPAIDTGDNSQCPALDARGIPRPFDGDGDATAVCDIGAVEARHQLSIADHTVIEGDSGSVTAVFTVTLSPSSTTAVTVQYATANDTATAGSDYTAASGTLTFNPGETEKQINISVSGDTDDELDETFIVQLSNPTNADLLDATAVGVIIDDDGLSALAISDRSQLEGNSGSSAMQFAVTLSPASASVITVTYATTNGTATAGNDYTAASNTLVFQPGETNKSISVNILGDNVDEGVSEDFTIQLSNPINAALADGEATGTITDDDEARLSHEFGPQVLEGDSGLTPAIFTVKLSTPADFVVTVTYAVSSGYGDDGAKSGEDFEPAAGTLTFQPGETTQTYTVQIIGDTLSENDETYSSLISNANVPLTVNSSTGKILNDDDQMLFLPLIIR